METKNGVRESVTTVWDTPSPEYITIPVVLQLAMPINSPFDAWSWVTTVKGF